MPKLDNSKLVTNAELTVNAPLNDNKATLARFISEATHKSKAPSKSVTFRFPNEYISLLEILAETNGVNRINVLKASLQMFNDAPDNEKNVYFVKTIK